MKKPDRVLLGEMKSGLVRGNEWQAYDETRERFIQQLCKEECEIREALELEIATHHQIIDKINALMALEKAINAFIPLEFVRPEVKSILTELRGEQRRIHHQEGDLPGVDLSI